MNNIYATMVLSIDPEPKGRPKFSFKTRHAYTPSKTRNYENELKKLIKQSYSGMILASAIHIDVCFYLKKPKSVKRLLPTVKPDLDNYEKSLFDAMNNIVYVDDALIVSKVSSKAYDAMPRIELKITVL